MFHMPREELEVKVHKRLKVRVLELIDESSGPGSNSGATGCR